MQLLFSFDRGTRVEKTLMQTLASQLSCNSCSRLTGAWELRKFWCKLSLLNSHQLSCNSCFRLTGAWELRKLSCKLSLLNSHATLVLVWPGAWELRKFWCKLVLCKLRFFSSGSGSGCFTVLNSGSSSGCFTYVNSGLDCGCFISISGSLVTR
jgi:hypothetical protein